MASFMDLTEEQKQRRREQKRAEALARKYALKAATLSAQSSSPPLPCHTCGADRLAGGRGSAPCARGEDSDFSYGAFDG